MGVEGEAVYSLTPAGRFGPRRRFYGGESDRTDRVHGRRGASSGVQGVDARRGRLPRRRSVPDAQSPAESKAGPFSHRAHPRAAWGMRPDAGAKVESPGAGRGCTELVRADTDRLGLVDLGPRRGGGGAGRGGEGRVRSGDAGPPLPEVGRQTRS